jgi:hypothetical protein
MATEFYNTMLCDAIVPVIRDYFLDMYEKPREGKTPTLIEFQKYLRTVNDWTSTQIGDRLTDIEKHCGPFKCYVKAYFVAYAKMIMNSVRLSSQGKNISVKVPMAETVVHYCFLRCAQYVYEHPDLIKNVPLLDPAIERIIIKTLRSLIPIQAILVDCIPISGNSVEFREPDAPFSPVQGTPPAPEPEKEPETEPGEEPEPEPTIDREEAFEEALNRESPITKSPFPVSDPPQMQQEAELYADAPDKKGSQI